MRLVDRGYVRRKKWVDKGEVSWWVDRGDVRRWVDRGDVRMGRWVDRGNGGGEVGG